jgi:hypothetical protein
MSQVVTLEGFTPTARYDATPWTEARIYEDATSTGTGTLIDTITLDPVDADPSDPQARNLTTELATDTPDLWYWIVFVDGTGDTSQPTVAVQNSASTSAPYSTVDELARILKIRTPTAEQTAAMTRVLETAAGEIDSEIDLADDADALAGWQLSLAAEVNLERAVEHWQQMESPFGLIGLSTDLGPTHTATDSWNRHANKLAPLKGQFGLA